MHAVMLGVKMVVGYNVMTNGACTDGCQAGPLVAVLQLEGYICRGRG